MQVGEGQRLGSWLGNKSITQEDRRKWVKNNEHKLKRAEMQGQRLGHWLGKKSMTQEDRNNWIRYNETNRYAFPSGIPEPTMTRTKKENNAKELLDISVPTEFNVNFLFTMVTENFGYLFTGKLT